MTILVTGASGFIGSFIVSEGLNLGHQMWAGIRGTSSREYLTDERIQFALLDLGNPEKLRTQLLQYREKLGEHGWDYVVHAAGATKCLHREDFFRTNTEGTQNLIEALRATNMIPQRFIFISSLSVFGAIREKPVRKASPDNPWIYSPILLTDTPQPNTAYGQSKLQAEDQSIKQHTDFSVGYKAQEITFVYMMDVVQAVFRCMDSPAALNHAYFLSDGHIYNSRHFSDLLQQEMGNPWVLHIKAPLWFLRIICWISGHLSHLTGKMNALNEDKYHILRQRNWQCDIGPAQRDFGYDPQWPLERGVKAAVKWYRENHWL